MSSVLAAQVEVEVDAGKGNSVVARRAVLFTSKTSTANNAMPHIPKGGEDGLSSGLSFSGSVFFERRQFERLQAGFEMLDMFEQVGKACLGC